jgi:hypothetical protein
MNTKRTLNPVEGDQEQVFDQLLDDAELLPILKAKLPIRFDGLASESVAIQNQVNRLNHGNSYVVTFTKEPPGNWTKLTPNPGYQVNMNPSRGLSTPSLVERPPSVLAPKGEPKKYAP